jgi:hypothetical protein
MTPCAALLRRRSGYGYTSRRCVALAVDGSSFCSVHILSEDEPEPASASASGSGHADALPWTPAVEAANPGVALVQ